MMIKRKTLLTTLAALVLAAFLLAGVAMAAEPTTDPQAAAAQAVTQLIAGDGDTLDELAALLSDATGAPITGYEDILALLRDTDTAEAAKLLRELLDMTSHMEDDALRREIAAAAAELGYSLEDSGTEAILRLCRSLEAYGVVELQEKLDGARDSLLTAVELGGRVTAFADSVRSFLGGAKDFVSGLFA